MKYDEALKAWGAKKLAEKVYEGKEIDPTSVGVWLDLEQGYGCSCSSDAYVYVEVYGSTTESGYTPSVMIDKDSFHFETFLKEVCEAANGAVTLE